MGIRGRRPNRVAIAFATNVLLAASLVNCGDEPTVDPSMGVDARTARPPNIVFILADDLGYSDTSLQGTSRWPETPNIQRLAERGMRFTQAYSSSSLCSATRASLLTGQAPGRLGLTGAGGHLPRVAERARRLTERQMSQRPRLRSKRALIARAATRMPAGSPTLATLLAKRGYATGHFGKWHLGSPPYGPRDFGFAVDVPGTHLAAPERSYLAPWGLPDAEGFEPREVGEHLEARMAREAIAFIEAHRDRPFFLNYWAFSVHEPFDADPARIERHARRLAREGIPANPTYAAMVEHFDEAVGALVDAIDRLGLAADTILVFSSDNGGSHFSYHAGRPVTSNAPLRGGKATIYEGGIRVPTVVVWPGRVEAGARSDALLVTSDWLPTLLELAGVDVPAEIALDGVSQADHLRGGDAPRETVVTYLPHYFPRPGTIPASSIRRDDWKLIRFHFDGADGEDRFELYDLARDPGEQRDLARGRPDVVQRLSEELARELDAMGALLPERNPLYQPDAARRG